jgi:PAS domain S-box-containing protein
MDSKRRFSIRAYLWAFSAAILIPVIGLASVLLWHFAQSEQARYEQEARAAAQRLIATVDVELSKMQAAAQALAASSRLQARDFAAFHREAVEAIRVWSPEDPNKLAVVVRDLSAQQVVNTRLPWGQSLGKGSNPEADVMVAEGKRPVIQDLFVGATAGHPIVSIRVPVFIGGEVPYVLSMALEPDRFLELLEAQKLPADWLGSLVDGNNRVIARSKEQPRFLGQLAPEDFRALAKGRGGAWTGHDLNGVPVAGGYARSLVSGWRTFVGMPLATAQEPLRRSLWLIAALALLALVLSTALGVTFGRRIARSVQGLAKSAQALGRGEQVRPGIGGLREIDEVAETLAAAAAELQSREAALKASEGRLRATHENAAVGIVEVDREGRFLYVNEAHCKLTGNTRENLLGRPFTEYTHGDDFDRDFDLFKRQVAGELDLYTIEKRHVRADGSTGWARTSSSAVRDANGAFLYSVRVVEDITERKQAENRQKLLVDELNHRVKNTLATVQSLAYQTFRQALPPDVARERFEARLLALSRTHNLLNESSWAGAPLRDVLALELEPFGGENGERVDMRGRNLHLPARLAVVLGMLFHELSTNAVKYGALSVAEGKVDVSWDLSAGEDGEAVLRLEWIERDGPKVETPTRLGFGSRLIQATVQQELGGSIDLRFEPAGLVCRMEIPLRSRPLPREMAIAAE